jgi:hypothetical protein
VLVVALGADLDPSATPGLVEAGHEFYTVDGAFAAREVLDRFEGGWVVVGVTSTPFEWRPERLVRALDPQRRVAVMADGADMPFDLFLGVPVDRAPQVVRDAGMCVDGWVPVDPLTLETAFPNVYAVATPPACALRRPASSPRARRR